MSISKELGAWCAARGGVGLSVLAGALAAGGVAAALLWAHAPAEAQGVMTAPACQCSAPTSVPGLGTTVAQCLCTGVTCVLAAPTSSNGPATLMQCVK